MIKAYSKKVDKKDYFGDVFSKEFSLPADIKEITAIMVNCTAYDPNNFQYCAGMVAISINEEQLISILVPVSDKAADRSFKWHTRNIKPAYKVKPNSLMRIILEEDDMKTVGAGVDILGYRIDVFITYNL